MKIKFLQAVIIAALTSTCLSGQQNTIDTILADTSLTGTSWSICFADAVTGEMIFGHDAERNLASASVMKLYPTSVALALLGPDYRFSTDIYISGKFNSRRGVVDGDVVIKGGGDPALGSEYFRDHYGDVVGQWTAALLTAGIRHVKGRVAAATSFYDFNPAPSGWSWGNLGQYYGAGVYDINFNDNKYNIYITGHNEGSPAVIDSVELYGRDVRLTNYLTSSGRSDQGYVYNTPYSHTAWISGSVPADSSFALKASNPDPPLTVVRLLDRAMRDAGIRIDGAVSAARTNAVPEEMTPLCVTLSPTLEEIVKVTNHESVNMYAEAIRKHLGYVILGEESYSAGARVIRSFLDSIGCEPYEAVILDGSGLSANNNISALMTVRLLVHMHNSPCTVPFIASLPEGAVSGTMKSYFRDEFFKGRVFAKTGTISSAKSFAGYVTTGSGRRLAFTMFANGFTVPNRKITDYMEAVVREIIEKY
ncbi:MAG: D-alanyl-D-alanine carboxypeptidase/D-alanyl-D-alanine-endopeptidase [Bacteroidales bacterium]|nr:D-alanyl-D-alanine carboxypeptidase/D-alanyl-D-alanine-endopeptidase [Bacteroidales bacterium]MDT8373963.1 D-alanyl-D-alanine carboxypeptidase/D-alanyl-D-alanine-endopeptidase [Bacteroidales bacterium]